MAAFFYSTFYRLLR